MRQRGHRLRLRFLLLLVLALVLPLALSHPGRVAGKTLLLLPDLFPTSPIRPLTWVSGQPRLEEYSYDFSVGHVDADIYLPAERGPHGAVIVVLGAVGFPRKDPTLVRFADGLARAGAVVMIPESSSLQQGDILPGEIDGLIAAVDYLRARPEVDPDRVGFVGFSVGGSLALIAAEDERGRDRIAYVNAFGSYFDAGTLLASVTSRQIVVDGQPIPWQPSDLTVSVFSHQVIDPLTLEQDREILGRAFLKHEGVAEMELAQLSPEGRLVQELFRHPTRARAFEILKELPPSLQARLNGISPASRIGRLRSAIYLMHDLSDVYIPYTHSRAMRDALPPGVLRSYTEFDLFSHVMPDRPVEGLHFVREVSKLYLHVWRLCQEFL